eukprot:tig00021365_g20814.t1
MSSAPAKNGEGGRRLSFAELALWLPFNLVFAIAPYPWIAAWTAGLQGPRSTWLPFASQFLKAAQPISRACGDLEHYSCPGAFAWDFALFMAFGALHSFMASATGKALVRSTVPPQVQPTIFAAVSNAAVICVAAAWASCPGAVWEAKSGALRVALLSGKILAIVADLSFNFHFPACDCERQFHTSLCGFDSLELFGTSALFQTAEEAAAAADSAPARDGHEPTLITTGLFRFVRCVISLI